MTTPELRALNIGEIVDVAINVYMRSARQLMGLAALVVVPGQLISGAVLLSIASNQDQVPGRSFLSTGSHASSDSAAYWVGQQVIVLVGIVVSLFATAACMKAVSETYLGGEADFGSSARFALRRMRPLLWLEFVYAILLVLALIALIVPGIYLYVAWSVSTPVLLIEDLRGRKALRRSRELVRGRWWSVFWVQVIATLMVTIAVALTQGVLVAVALSGTNSVLATVVVVTIAGGIGAIVSQPMRAAITAVLYYDLRVRKEGFDVELLAERLGLSSVEVPSRLAARPASAETDGGVSAPGGGAESGSSAPEPAPAPPPQRPTPPGEPFA
jgi:hypothetical protein